MSEGFTTAWFEDQIVPKGVLGFKTLCAVWTQYKETCGTPPGRYSTFDALLRDGPAALEKLYNDGAEMFGKYFALGNGEYSSSLQD